MTLLIANSGLEKSGNSVQPGQWRVVTANTVHVTRYTILVRLALLNLKL